MCQVNFLVIYGMERVWWAWQGRSFFHWITPSHCYFASACFFPQMERIYRNRVGCHEDVGRSLTEHLKQSSRESFAFKVKWWSCCCRYNNNGSCRLTVWKKYVVVPKIFTLLISVWLIFVVIHYLRFQVAIKIRNSKNSSQLIFECLIFTISFNCELLTTTKISKETKTTLHLDMQI